MMTEDTSGGDVANKATSPDPPGDIESPSLDPPATRTGADPSTDAGGGDGSRKDALDKRWKLVAVSSLVAIVLAIVLGVTLSRPPGGGDASDASSNVDIKNDKGGGELFRPTNETTTLSTVATTTSGDETSPATTTVTEPPKEDGTTIIEPADNDTTTTLPTNDAPLKGDDVTAPAVQYLRSVGPIPTRVRMIDSAVADGYDSCDELREDMLNALNHYANTLIVRESKYNWYEKCDPDNPQPYRPLYAADESVDIAFSVAPPPEVAAESSKLPSVAAGASALAADSEPKEDSFDTNNQVEGVDEGDIVKSDGTYVYAAYGDLLYVWNATDGTQGISITEMPYEELNETDCKWNPYPIYGRPFLVHEPLAVKVEESLVADVNEDVVISFEDVPEKTPDPPESLRGRRNRRRGRRKALSVAPGWNPCHKPKPRILSLLLEGTRLTVIVSEDHGYRSWYHGYETDEATRPVIDDHSKLFIRVYNVSSVPIDGSPLQLLGEKEIKGNYNSARSVGDTGLVVTTSHIKMWLFGNDLYRSDPRYCGMNSTEYVAAAGEVAQNITGRFLERMLKDMQLQLGGTCDGIFQVAAMQSGESDEDQSGGNLLSQFVQVLSFDMSSDFENGTISTNVAGAFNSGWLSSVYASQGFVATLNQGSHYNSTTDSWDSATFIRGFNVTGATPVPFCYAEVKGRPGLPNNPYVTDLYQGHLRVVTTERRWRNVEGSRTTNKIFILKVPKAGEGQEMIQTAETEHLGKPNEGVEAVRFIGPKAYIVTFERTDPFYIYNLADPYKPEKLGELEVPGFSSYLHPIDIDGVELMLGIGVHVDPETQDRVGLKISLYDISNATNPTENATFVDEGAYSSGGYDFKSFRFLTQSKKLILPKREYSEGDGGNFDGFVVYDVGLGSVAPSHEIQHASAYAMNYGCWYNARMPARSFVFQSKLTTILSHSVISTDLADGDKLWNLTLGDGLSNDNCWPYFF